MISFPQTPELLAVAERTVWFKPPAEAIADTAHFIAHVLTYGMPDDVKTMRQYLSANELRTAVESAPPGVFDERSWSYWNAVIGKFDTPPLPVRNFPD